LKVEPCCRRRFNTDPLICLPSEVDDTSATFSNWAVTSEDMGHTIAAPAACIASTDINSGYAVWSGTSFATPLVSGTVALCIYSGACAGMTPAQVISKIVTDARVYNEGRKGSGYGFQGDPLRPISGKYYGYLIRAALY
jgi:subtilisin